MVRQIVNYLRLDCISCLFTLLCICCVAGCSTEKYKSEADDEVYSIIDSKWRDDYGARANYKISDVKPLAGDIDPNTLVTSGKLSLAEAVTLATAQNRTYQSRKELLYVKALDLTGQRQDFKGRFFGLASAGYTHNSAGESVDAGGEVSFRQLLADGAVIGSSIAIDWARFLTGDPDMSLGSVLRTTITQPILGSGRRSAQERLTLAERSALYEIRNFNRYRKSFVVSIVDDYYKVLQQLDKVSNEKNNFDNLTTSQLRIEAMADTGRLPRFQASEAQQSTLASRDRYVSAEETYKALLDGFKITLGLPTDVDIELDPAELAGLEKVGISDPNTYDLEEATQIALAHRMDLANARERLEDAERNVALAADGLGIDLDLFAGIGVDSKPDTDFSNLLFHRGDYSVGLNLDQQSFDRKGKRNTYRKALINYNNVKRNLEEDIDNIKLAVRQAYRDLSGAYTSYRIREMSLRLAGKRVQMQSILLQEGRSTTRDYLFAQSDLLSAQNAKTAALVKYTISKLSFIRDIGLLQVRSDGLWELPQNLSQPQTQILPDDSQGSHRSNKDK